MSSSSSRNVQVQWDLSTTTLLARDTVISLLKVASETEVQPQAVIAMEGLGAAIGGRISPGRIAEAVTALSGGENRIFEWLKVSIGLKSGIARVMKSSVPLVLSFLLTIACKPSFTNEEIGRLLYDMMACRNILKSVPVSPSQITQLVDTISGYGHHMIPMDHFSTVALTIQTNIPSRGEFPLLFQRSSPKGIAEVLSAVFEGLQNEDISQVTLDGSLCGAWILSLFLWLLPNDTECIVNNARLFGSPRSHLSLRLVDQDSWHIRKWRSADELGVLIVRDETLSKLRYSPMSHYPLRAARSTLSAQFGMSSKASEATGQLAAALVDIAVEHGCIRSAHHIENPLSIPLSTICQESFEAQKHTIMECFGWETDSEFRQNQLLVAKSIEQCINEPGVTLRDDTREKDLDCIQNILYSVYRHHFDTNHSYMLLANEEEFLNIIGPAVHLATEALLHSLCDKSPTQRAFRPCTSRQLDRNACILKEIVFLESKRGCSYSLFRNEALKASIPGFAGEAEGLAVSSNGYVAFASSLGRPTTDVEISTAISVIPGALKWDSELGHFDRLVENRMDDSLCARTIGPFRHIAAFAGEEYHGFEDSKDPNDCEIRTFLSAAGKTLSLATYIQLGQHQTAPSVLANWESSMEAIVFARHVHEYNISPASEERLARRWHNKGFINRMAWCEVGETASDAHAKWHITKTSMDETLRFFEAGHWGFQERRRMFVRHKAPLVQCIANALELGEETPWVIIS
ncbi:hypothetical protein MMC20_005635 [Loxospora ochrophaea]|nr:hypothetical protein [Loxospora ochrophaea]